MADRERETHVVTSGGGAAGWLIACILIVVLVVVGFLFYGGAFDEGDLKLRGEAPTAGAPADQGTGDDGADTFAPAPQTGAGSD